MGLKLSMWPIFQKEMNAQVDSVKKLADAAVGGGFGAMLNKGPRDSAVRQVCERYAEFFSYVVALSSDEDEAMVFTRYVKWYPGKCLQGALSILIITNSVDAA